MSDAVPALVRLTVKPAPVVVSVPAAWSIAVVDDDPDVNVTVPPDIFPERAMVPVVAVNVLSLLPANEPALVIEMLLLSEVNVALDPVPVNTAATVRLAVPAAALVDSKASVPDEVVFWLMLIEAPFNDNPVKDVLALLVDMAPALVTVRFAAPRLLRARSVVPSLSVIVPPAPFAVS